MKNENLKNKVESIVAEIPEGRVMTYGQLAALAGSPRAARIVGGIAHFGGAYLHTTPNCPRAQRTAPPELLAQKLVKSSSSHSSSREDASLRSSDLPTSASRCESCAGKEIPWHRVVNKQGGLASGYPGGRKAHGEHLRAEGITLEGKESDYRVDVENLIWWPSK